MAQCKSCGQQFEDLVKGKCIFCMQMAAADKERGAIEEKSGVGERYEGLDDKPLNNDTINLWMSGGTGGAQPTERNLQHRLTWVEGVLRDKGWGNKSLSTAREDIKKLLESQYVEEILAGNLEILPLKKGTKYPVVVTQGIVKLVQCK